jgi:hypothetical protein
VAKFLEQYFKNLTVPKISEAEAFYLSEEIAKAVTILSENPATPFDVVWDKIHGISSETPEGVKPGGSLPLGDKGTQQMFGELLFPSPTPETPRGNEFIAWCDEHGRETVKKVMFGHFNSKVSGFTIFFECGGRQWYKLPFLLDPVFTRPSKSSDGEHAGAGYGAQGEPAPSHTTDVLGLETPASKSSEGRLCKHLNAIDDSRCERPEDDPIHDPRTAGAHVYDPLPPDDSIDTCCYICAAHPYAWIECKGTRGDGDCSKCTPCPIFKPRSPAAATGAAAVTPIVGSAPALAETAGDTEWHSIRYYDNEKDEGVKHPTCVSLAEAKAKLAAAEKHGLKMWEDGVATANKQDAVRVERIKELEASLAMAEDAANKGDKARKEAAGMEERIAELEARLKDCEQCNLIRNAVVSEYEKEKVGLEARLAAADDTILKNEAIYQQNIGKVEHRLAAAEAACDEGSLQRTEYMLKRIAELEAEADDSDKCYEEDRKTITSLLEQRDKLANEVNRLQTALDGAADLMIGGVEGPVQPPKSDLTPGVYWVRVKCQTYEHLRKKHNMPDWYAYHFKWDGEHWTGDGTWSPCLTMNEFKQHGYQLGPRVENEPKDDQYHEVK